MNLVLKKTNLTNLEFLNSSSIEALYVSQTKISDEQLQLLSAKSLRTIDLLKCPINSIFPLRTLNIEELNISGTEVDDLNALKESPLKSLDIRVTNISDLSPISSCPIENLYLPGSKVESLSAIVNCPIKELNIVGLSIDDLTPLLNLPLLKLSISRDLLKGNDLDIIRQLNLKKPLFSWRFYGSDT